MRATARFPVATLTVVGLAVVVSASPVLSPWFEWDRAAIAGGQWWRLATGNLVHYTPAHLYCDAIAVAILGWMIEVRVGRSLAILSVATALAIGLSVYALCPSVRYYGGLSGLACGMCGYLALLGIQAGAAARWLGRVLLALLAGKIGWEATTGQSLLEAIASQGYVVLPLAHVTGFILGVWAGLIREPALVRCSSVGIPAEGVAGKS